MPKIAKNRFLFWFFYNSTNSKIFLVNFPENWGPSMSCQPPLGGAPVHPLYESIRTLHENQLWSNLVALAPYALPICRLLKHVLKILCNLKLNMFYLIVIEQASFNRFSEKAKVFFWCFLWEKCSLLWFLLNVENVRHTDLLEYQLGLRILFFKSSWPAKLSRATWTLHCIRKEKVRENNFRFRFSGYQSLASVTSGESSGGGGGVLNSKQRQQMTCLLGDAYFEAKELSKAESLYQESLQLASQVKKHAGIPAKGQTTASQHSTIGM